MSASPRAELGIIGGSGLYDMEGLTDREELTVSTPFGEPSGAIVLGTLEGRGSPSCPGTASATG